MKRNGLFSKLSASVAALFAMGGTVASPEGSTVSSKHNGRDGFYRVSQPRTRAMKRRHPL